MKNSVSEYQYPLNLYRDLCSKMGKPLPDKITEDQLKGLNILIGRIPNERYRVILFERYLYCKTYDEIAEEHGFSSSRAGQILDVTLKKLCNNDLSEMLISGYDEFIATETIDILGLSTRAQMAFLRNNLNTLEDLKYFGRDKIKKLRSVGESTLSEIWEKTSFLWDEEELKSDRLEEENKLSPRQAENLKIALTKKGLSPREISRIINFVQTNNPENESN